MSEVGRLKKLLLPGGVSRRMAALDVNNHTPQPGVGTLVVHLGVCRKRLILVQAD